tara:strand:- start:15 stop:212 length:198 start_codon:yes stop_codon:yes gene_type:complete
MKKKKKHPGKDCQDDPINPNGKARIISDIMTNDLRRANEIFSVITHELTGEEIDIFYELLTIKQK